MLPEIRRPSVPTSLSFWLNSCERHRQFSPLHREGRASMLLSSCLLARASPRSTIAFSFKRDLAFHSFLQRQALPVCLRIGEADGN